MSDEQAGPDERVIAIDGPAGSGKSTVGRALARRLSLTYLDTGAMYRAVAFAAIRRGVDPADGEPVASVARSLECRIDDDVVTVDGVDATIEIRGDEVSRAVSLVAANPDVREELRARQRIWAMEHGGGVIEGRDIGSVVFPNALLKVYLTADEQTRAGRRAAERSDTDVAKVHAELASRDAQDRERADSPLVEPDGAVTVDTSDLGVDAVVDLLVGLVEQRAEEAST